MVEWGFWKVKLIMTNKPTHLDDKSLNALDEDLLSVRTTNITSNQSYNKRMEKLC